LKKEIKRLLAFQAPENFSGVSDKEKAFPLLFPFIFLPSVSLVVPNAFRVPAFSTDGLAALQAECQFLIMLSVQTTTIEIAGFDFLHQVEKYFPLKA